MRLTPSSILSSVMLISLVISFICIILKCNILIKNINFTSMFVCLGIIFIRLILPVEFKYSISFPSSTLLPNIYKILNTKIGIRISSLLAIIWILIAVLKIYYNLSRYLSLINCAQKVSFADDKKINDLIKSIINERKNRTHIYFRVIKSANIDTPMILGIRTPIIMMPDSDFTYDENYYILKHEIEHYYANHLLLKLIFTIISCIYWWNPIIYLLKKTINNCMEIQVDILITNDLNEKQKLSYLSCLLKVAKNSTNNKYKYFLPFSSKYNSPLKQRFQIILSKRASFNKRICTSFIIVLFLLLLFIPSYLLVFEPYIITEDIKKETFILNDDFYLVENNENFSLYNGDEFIACIVKLDDNLSNLPILKKPKELNNKYEKKSK